jgi:hypothetical protein
MEPDHRAYDRDRSASRIGPSDRAGVCRGLEQLSLSRRRHAASALRTALWLASFSKKRKSQRRNPHRQPDRERETLSIPTPEERIEYLRWRTYLLANRNEYKTDTRRFVSMRRARTSEPIAAAVSPELLAKDVAALGAAAKLAESGALDAYIARAEQIPNVLEEIGRLREITFRAAGEGTGRAADLDRFDAHYLHLFLWNRENAEVVGSYRLSGVEVGADGCTPPRCFTTARRFSTSSALRWNWAAPGFALTIRKRFAPLLLLWKGIGSSSAAIRATRRYSARSASAISIRAYRAN